MAIAEVRGAAKEAKPTGKLPSSREKRSHGVRIRN
jgi:hypothetical protein